MERKWWGWMKIFMEDGGKVLKIFSQQNWNTMRTKLDITRKLLHHDNSSPNNETFLMKDFILKKKKLKKSPRKSKMKFSHAQTQRTLAIKLLLFFFLMVLKVKLYKIWILFIHTGERFFQTITRMLKHVKG